MKRFLFKRDTPTLSLWLLILALVLSDHVSNYVVGALVVAALFFDVVLPKQGKRN